MFVEDPFSTINCSSLLFRDYNKISLTSRFIHIKTQYAIDHKVGRILKESIVNVNLFTLKIEFLEGKLMCLLFCIEE